MIKRRKEMNLLCYQKIKGKPGIKRLHLDSMKVFSVDNIMLCAGYN